MYICILYTRFLVFDNIDTKGKWQWIDIADSTLLAGNHYLTIMYRTNQVKLDKVYITNDPDNQTLDGIGGEETPCISAPTCSIIDFENGNIDGWTIQNPGGSIAITQECVNSGKYVLKIVSPASGSIASDTPTAFKRIGAAGRTSARIYV